MNKLYDKKFLESIVQTILSSKNLSEVHNFTSSLKNDKIISKEWLASETLKFIKPKTILILGAWYPIILPLLLSNNSTIDCVDSDPNVKNLSDTFNNFFFKTSNLRNITADARSYLMAIDHNAYDLIVNTSCEHMDFDMKDLVYKSNALYAFQSNDYYFVKEHINCKKTLDEFICSTGINNVFYSGSLPFVSPLCKYNRFMVIGKVC